MRGFIFVVLTFYWCWLFCLPSITSLLGSFFHFLSQKMETKEQSLVKVCTWMCGFSLSDWACWLSRTSLWRPKPCLQWRVLWVLLESKAHSVLLEPSLCCSCVRFRCPVPLCCADLQACLDSTIDRTSVVFKCSLLVSMFCICLGDLFELFGSLRYFTEKLI